MDVRRDASFAPTGAWLVSHHLNAHDWRGQTNGGYAVRSNPDDGDHGATDRELLDPQQWNQLTVSTHGRLSLAWRLRFQAPDRTLTEDEIDTAIGEISARLATDLGGRIRS